MTALTLRKSALGRLLGSEARAKILSTLLLGAGERYYVRGLAVRLGIPPTAVSRELATLEALGLVVRRSEGRRVYCELNARASVLDELRGLVLKLGGIQEALRQALQRQGHSIQWAFLFGSMAAGSATAASDVDLFVVGSISSLELSEALGPLGVALGREINPYVLSAGELRAKRRQKNHFVTRVLAGPRIDLIGNESSATATD